VKPDPVVFLETLNRTVYKNIQRMQTDKNLTFALIKYQQGEVKIIGQHEEVLVVRKDGVVERVDTLHLGFQILTTNLSSPQFPTPFR